MFGQSQTEISHEKPSRWGSGQEEEPPPIKTCKLSENEDAREQGNVNNREERRPGGTEGSIEGSDE